jgi:hypothetical protein
LNLLKSKPAHKEDLKNNKGRPAVPVKGVDPWLDLLYYFAFLTL